VNEISLDQIKTAAEGHGWTAPLGTDHVLYVAHAVRGLRTLADGGPALAPRERGLWWAYAKEARDLDPDGLCGLAPDGLAGLDADEVLWLALYAPARMAAEVALLAAGRRRTGRAQKLTRRCRRIQLAADRHGHGPVGRAGARGAYVGGDGRTRGLFLLAREERSREEEAWSRFWAVCEGGRHADVRPSPRQRGARVGGAEGGVDWFAVEGGGF